MDRCDRCCAHARQTWRKPGGATVTLCDHHGRQHEVALLEQGFSLVEPAEAPA